MKPNDLSTMSAGFSDKARGSQAVFRAALQALSHPGRRIDVAHDAEVPRNGHAASAALLLALLDAACTLWLSPSLAGSDAAAWLRFHTGCTLVDDPAQARFAWAAHAGELPPLTTFEQGSDAYPDQSATCVIDVPAIADGMGAGWTLRGPGICDGLALQVEGLPQGFLDQWTANHASFPRGIDLFLATPDQIVGLPRTTRIELSVEA